MAIGTVPGTCRLLIALVVEKTSRLFSIVKATSSDTPFGSATLGIVSITGLNNCHRKEKGFAYIFESVKVILYIGVEVSLCSFSHLRSRLSALESIVDSNKSKFDRTTPLSRPGMSRTSKKSKSQKEFHYINLIEILHTRPPSSRPTCTRNHHESSVLLFRYAQCQRYPSKPSKHCRRQPISAIVNCQDAVKTPRYTKCTRYIVSWLSNIGLLLPSAITATTTWLRIIGNSIIPRQQQVQLQAISAEHYRARPRRRRKHQRMNLLQTHDDLMWFL